MARKNFTLDDSGFNLKAAGLIAASAACTPIADLGEGFVEANVVIDVTALEVATDEIYDIVFQLSPDAAFGTVGNIVENGEVCLCHSSVTRTDAAKTSAIGRYILPVTNLHNGTIYRYARLYTVAAGTIATGINYVARLCKR